MISCSVRLQPFFAGQIENVVPQFGTTGDAKVAVIVCQTMPVPERLQVRAARFQINCIGCFLVENSVQTAASRAFGIGAVEKINFFRNERLIESVRLLHTCTFFVVVKKSARNRNSPYPNSLVVRKTILTDTTSQESRTVVVLSQLFVRQCFNFESL